MGAAQSGKGGHDDSGFDADVAISTGELRRLLPELISALGGLHERQAVATAAPAAVKEAATASGSTFAPWDTVPA